VQAAGGVGDEHIHLAGLRRAQRVEYDRTGIGPIGLLHDLRAAALGPDIQPPSPPVEQLVVAISSRALFDFEEENQVFETADDRAYMRMQLDRLERPAKPGVAYRLVRKLLAFNADAVRRVEVVILSRNDPVSGLRVFRSVKGAGLAIERGSNYYSATPCLLV
jgi:hypothetical protein